MGGILKNIARMTTSTTGQGTITLGSAVSGFLSFSGAGVSDGDVISYAIEDGSNREIGTGTYTSSGTTLSRTVLKSTNSDAAINLSGSAEVFIDASAEDMAGIDAAATLGKQRGPLAPHDKLVVLPNSTNPLYQVDIDADKIRLFDGTSRTKVFSSVNETVDITASGVDGLDTGSESSSQWYYIYIIAKEDGTVASLMSTSATAPTMPTDYVYKGLVSAVYNGSGSDIVPMNQIDNKVGISQQTEVSSGTATSWTSVSVLVPPIANVFLGHVSSIHSTVNARYMRVAADSSGRGIMAVGGNQSGSGYRRHAPVRVAMATAQTVYYSVNSGSSFSGALYLNGWEF